MNTAIMVGLGGGLGALLRHAVSLVALRLWGEGFPLATLAINVSGSLAMGVLVGVFLQRWAPGPEVRAFLTTGILGGFTTFSTFSLDAVQLWDRGEPGQAVLYVLASVALGIAALAVGVRAAAMVA